MIPATSLLATTRSGSSSGRVRLDDGEFTGSSAAGFRLSTDGLAYGRMDGTYYSIYPWLLSGALADYEVYVSLDSGSTTTGSSRNTWLSLDTVRTWSVQSPPGFENASVLIVQIRDKNTLTVLDEALVTLAAYN